MEYIAFEEFVEKVKREKPILFELEHDEMADDILEFLVKYGLSFLFQICFVVGIMMISQTTCHILAGVELTIPVILTKSGTFLLLGGFAFYFQRKIFKELKK